MGRQNSLPHSQISLQTLVLSTTMRRLAASRQVDMRDCGGRVSPLRSERGATTSLSRGKPWQVSCGHFVWLPLPSGKLAIARSCSASSTHECNNRDSFCNESNTPRFFHNSLIFHAFQAKSGTCRFFGLCIGFLPRRCDGVGAGQRLPSRRR
jgi:hypothetical protein